MADVAPLLPAATSAVAAAGAGAGHSPSSPGASSNAHGSESSRCRSSSSLPMASLIHRGCRERSSYSLAKLPATSTISVTSYSSTTDTKMVASADGLIAR
jgi:hypothetical protein